MDKLLSQFLYSLGFLFAAPFIYIFFYFLYKWITYSNEKYNSNLPAASVPGCFHSNTFIKNKPIPRGFSVIVTVGCGFLSFVSIGCAINAVRFFLEFAPVDYFNLTIAVITSSGFLAVSMVTGYFAFCLYKIARKDLKPLTVEDYYEFEGIIQSARMTTRYSSTRSARRRDSWEVIIDGAYFYFPPTMSPGGGFLLHGNIYNRNDRVKVGFVNRRSQTKGYGVWTVGIESIK